MHLIAKLSIIAVLRVLCNICIASAKSVDGDRFLQSSYIVGGSPPESLTRPEVFYLYLYQNGKLIQTCVASLLSVKPKTYVWITTAQCLDSDKYERIEAKYYSSGIFVVLASHWNDIEYNIHPLYNNNTNEHNIAVIKPPFSLSNDINVRETHLPVQSEDFVNKRADIFLEWKQKDRGYALHTIQTKVINPAWCKFWYRWSSIKNYIVCASGWYGKGLDKDEVGIPLVVKNNESFKLIGISTKIRSWTRWFGLPIEFLSITPYIEWIQCVSTPGSKLTCDPKD